MRASAGYRAPLAVRNVLSMCPVSHRKKPFCLAGWKGLWLLWMSKAGHWEKALLRSQRSQLHRGAGQCKRTSDSDGPDSYARCYGHQQQRCHGPCSCASWDPHSSTLGLTSQASERFGQAATVVGIGAVGGTPPASIRADPGAESAPNKHCQC